MMREALLALNNRQITLPLENVTVLQLMQAKKEKQPKSSYFKVSSICICMTFCPEGNKNFAKYLVPIHLLVSNNPNFFLFHSLKYYEKASA